MSIEKQLQSAKEVLLTKITEAAKHKDTKTISKLGTIAAKLDDDERTVRKLREALIHYRRIIEGKTADFEILTSTDSETGGTGRGEGREARTEFIAKAKERGVPLRHVTGVLYLGPSDKKVAVAFANERAADRWFLGIPDQRYDFVVLLCKPTSGDVVALILAQATIKRVWSSLSRSKGQVKFNVGKASENYWLTVPSHGREDLTRTVDDFSAFDA
jgi:hypothetical protein